MTQRAPVLLAVDDDPAALDRIEGELLRRYGGDYRVVCECAAGLARDHLERMREAGDQVALVLADQWMPEETGSAFLGRVRSLHPGAKRALLIDWGAWGDRPTAEAILGAMALGRIDYYVLKPWRVRDEQFHRMVAEFLHEWSREHSPDATELVVVADRWSPRGHELRDLLARSGVPHGFYEAGSARARELLAGTEGEDATAPVIRMHDGRVRVDPSNAELAAAFGVETELPERRDYDLIVVGAGPAGLSAAVYASSEGLRTLVVERASIGGQAGSSSLIRNYLGFSRGVSGGELAQRAYQQAWVFGAEFLIMREAAELQPGEERHSVTIPGAGTATARAVVLATGVSYARLAVPGLEQLVGSGVFYGASTVEAQGMAGQHVYVVGGGNSAGQAAVHLCRSARRVTILVRGPSLAADMSSYLRDTVAAAPNVEVRLDTEVVDGGGSGRLEWLELRDNASGRAERVPAAALFVLIGARPHTGWLPEALARDERGYVLTGPEAAERGDLPWPLPRPPMLFETSVPGIFAVGDVRQGSVKRVASSVGEGSVAVGQVHEWLAEADASRAAATEPDALHPGEAGSWR